MPKYKVMFAVNKSGTLHFDADDADHARELYDQLVNGETYPDDLDSSYEELEESDTSWFELTDNSGRVLAS